MGLSGCDSRVFETGRGQLTMSAKSSNQLALACVCALIMFPKRDGRSVEICEFLAHFCFKISLGKNYPTDFKRLCFKKFFIQSDMRISLETDVSLPTRTDRFDQMASCLLEENIVKIPVLRSLNRGACWTSSPVFVVWTEQTWPFFACRRRTATRPNAGDIHGRSFMRLYP